MATGTLPMDPEKGTVLGRGHLVARTRVQAGKTTSDAHCLPRSRPATKDQLRFPPECRRRYRSETCWPPAIHTSCRIHKRQTHILFCRRMAAASADRADILRENSNTDCRKI